VISVRSGVYFQGIRLTDLKKSINQFIYAKKANEQLQTAIKRTLLQRRYNTKENTTDKYNIHP
jgi:hypothetical protein